MAKLITFEIHNELEEYAVIEGTEFGQSVIHALSMYEYDYMYGETLFNELEKFLMGCYKWFNTNTVIVEEKYTVTHKIKDLEVIDMDLSIRDML